MKKICAVIALVLVIGGASIYKADPGTTLPFKDPGTTLPF